VKLLSENQVALEAAVKERDQFKKTAVDRASRIAELEAQVADQAERQKQIDEQMIRAETQLEMLKEFLQPAFQ
jgi:predicted  nucleic acid-binding Zn-ribbon protein